MSAVRKEKDSLGFVEVPERAYYGAQTARAVENYPISGMRAHPLLIRAFGMVKRAAAEANKALGLISDRRADAIIQAAQEVIEGKWNDEFVVDVFQAGAGVSFHMNTNEVLANRANEILGGKLGEYSEVHPNDHVNYGQSTNDVFPTGMRVGTLLVLETLYPVLDTLASTFREKAAEFDGILKSGRTHMQDAVPIRLGQEFAAYGVAIEKTKRALLLASDALRELGLGGSAVGTGINTHPDYREKAIANLARISREELTPAADMRWAMQSNACMGEVSAALRGVALEVIRISNDLRLLSSGPNTGFAEIYLPSLQPGSSIMPGKINPVMPELAAMVSFQVVGNDAAVAMAVQGGQLELNVMMPTMAYNHSGQYAAPVQRSLRRRHYRQQGPLRILRAKHGFAGYGPQPVHRLCQGRRNREGIDCHRRIHHQDRPRQKSAERGRDQCHPRSRQHDRTAIPARICQGTRPARQGLSPHNKKRATFLERGLRLFS
jgi:aspartate ammonia-lyase